MHENQTDNKKKKQPNSQIPTACYLQDAKTLSKNYTQQRCINLNIIHPEIQMKQIPKEERHTADCILKTNAKEPLRFLQKH